VTPPPLDRWIDAVLMLFVSLVHHAASLLRMGRIRLPAECHSDVTHPSLPEGSSCIDKKEPLEAPGEGRDPASAQRALATRTCLTPRPTKVGSHGRLCVLFHPAASSPRTRANRSRIPALAGMSGEGCLKSA